MGWESDPVRDKNGAWGPGPQGRGPRAPFLGPGPMGPGPWAHGPGPMGPKNKRLISELCWEKYGFPVVRWQNRQPDFDFFE